MDDLERLKRNVRESAYPFFEDSELEDILEESSGDVKEASYRALLRKSEDTSIIVSGFTAGDSSRYFLRLAQQYRPRNSGVLKGG